MIIGPLAREVLIRAFRDLRLKPEVSFDDPLTARKAVSVRQDAVEFLTAATPPMAASLETWCAFAGLDPNYVVRRTKDYLEKGAFLNAE